MKLEAGPVTDELVAVEDWRREQLELAGVRPPLAALLAASDADLHVILKAKAAGCVDHLLRRIFL